MLYRLEKRNNRLYICMKLKLSDIKPKMKRINDLNGRNYSALKRIERSIAFTSLVSTPIEI